MTTNITMQDVSVPTQKDYPLGSMFVLTDGEEAVTEESLYIIARTGIDEANLFCVATGLPFDLYSSAPVETNGSVASEYIHALVKPHHITEVDVEIFVTNKE